MKQKEFNIMLEKYADVIVKVGLNLRAGQNLTIRAIIEDAPLVRKVTESAYKAGAHFVDVLWTDEQLTHIQMQHASSESLEHVPAWMLPRFEEYLKRGDADLALTSFDPDLMKDMDPERVAKYRNARLKVFEQLSQYENFANWCVAATASPAWSKKVFPDLSVTDAQSALWNAIFKVCRADQPDPVQAWKMHTQALNKYKDYLNSKKYSALRYTAPGTDLTVGLPESQIWQGTEAVFENGIISVPNIPTEEVFTLPHREKVNGTVKSTRPLSVRGTLIDEFSITFKDGRAVDFSAQKGEDDLRKLIETDENACRLGEVALVPNSSPISQSDLLFYNTLFDENASCHFALGRAYRDSMKGGVDMTDEEFASHGGNTSMIHIDFMIGSEKLDVDGITANGIPEPLMRNGEWVMQV